MIPQHLPLFAYTDPAPFGYVVCVLDSLSPLSAGISRLYNPSLAPKGLGWRLASNKQVLSKYLSSGCICKARIQNHVYLSSRALKRHAPGQPED